MRLLRILGLMLGLCSVFAGAKEDESSYDIIRRMQKSGPDDQVVSLPEPIEAALRVTLFYFPDGYGTPREETELHLNSVEVPKEDAGNLPHGVYLFQIEHKPTGDVSYNRFRFSSKIPDERRLMKCKTLGQLQKLLGPDMMSFHADLSFSGSGEAYASGTAHFWSVWTWVNDEELAFMSVRAHLKRTKDQKDWSVRGIEVSRGLSE